MGDENSLFAAIENGYAERVQELLSNDPELGTMRTDSDESALMVAIYHNRPEITALLRKYARRLDIWEAAALGERPTVKRLVEKDASLVNVFSADGHTPLGLSAFFGNLGVFKYLISRGADVNAASRNSMRVRPIHSAVAQRDGKLALGMIRTLVEHKGQINVAQHGGWTPLHQAAAQGFVDVVRFLLENGANAASKSDEGVLALHLARKNGHTLIAEILESGSVQPPQ